MTNIEKRACAFLTACAMCFSMVMPAAAEDVPLIMEEVPTAPQESEFIEDIQVSDITQIEPETEMRQTEAETSAEPPLRTEVLQTELTETEGFIDETMAEVFETEPQSQGETEGMLEEIPFTDSEIVLEQIEEVSEPELETETELESETEPDEQTAAMLSNQEWEYYVLDDVEKTAAITRYKGTETVLAIPSEIMVSEEYLDPDTGENKIRDTVYTVVSVGDSAFSGRSEIIEVKLPDTVTSISNSAFSGCTELNSVSLGSSIEEIGDSAFSGCEKLRKINFPDGLQKIGSSAFYETGLVSIELPDSVTEIGDSAFRFSRIRTAVLPQSLTRIESLVFENSKLTEITIPNSVKTIESFAFGYCSNLTTVKGGSGLTHIAENAFLCSNNLTTIELTGNIEYVGENAFDMTAWYDNQPYGELSFGSVFYGYKGNMPENYTWMAKPWTSCIAAKAFMYQDNLTCAALPEGLKGIGDEAFFATGLRQLYIPASVTKIGLEAVGYDEKGLVPDFVIYGYAGSAAQTYANNEGIHFVEWNSDITQCEIRGIEDTYEYTGAEIVPEIRVINQGMEVAPDNYTVSCQNNIEIGTATVTIEGRGSLTGRVTKTFEIIKSMTEQGLTYEIVDTEKKTAIITGYLGRDPEVIIPKTIPVMEEDGNGVAEYTVVGVGRNAFEHNKEITEVTIPNTVTAIQYASFGDCSNLKNVIFEEGSQLETIGASAFQDNVSLKEFTCPEGLKVIGESAFRGNTVQTDIYLNDQLETVEIYAFSDSGLQRVRIPDTVTNVWKEAFYGCSELSSVTLGKSVEVIEQGAFSECKKLKEITIPTGVRIIGRFAFSGTGLTSICLPDTVTEIQDYAFSGSDLTSAVLSQSLERIGHAAFRHTKLSAIEIPDSVTYIGNWAFYNCKNLTDVKIGNGLTYISKNAFYGSGVKNLVIGNKVQVIEDNAFNANKELTSVKIPSNVTSIQYRAFYDCSNLLSIELPDTIEQLGAETFHKTAWYDRLPNGAAYLGKTLYTYKGVMPKDSMLLIKPDTYCIAEEACVNQQNLVSVSLPEGLKSIGAGAFLHTGLKSVYIPASVTKIGVEAMGYRSEKGDIDIWRREHTDKNGVLGPIVIGYSNTSVVPEFVIYGYAGTEAESYAKNNGIQFVSLNKDISKCTILGIESSYAYTGSAIKPSITVVNNGIGVSPENYTVSYSNNVEVGTASVTIKGKASLSGSITKTFKITGTSLQDCEITGIASSYTYTGSEIKPDITVKHAGKVLTSDNYTVSYKDNANVGPATVIITGKGSLTGSVTKTFEILPASIKKCSISGLEKPFDYTGKYIQPKITVKTGNKMVPSANYTVSYKNNKKIGTATVTIKGKGCLTDSVTKTFVIQPKITVKNTEYTKTVGSAAFKLNAKANGRAKLKYTSDDKKVVTVKDGKVFIKGSGKAVITVSATANGIIAVKQINITVEPKKMAAPSLKVKKKNLTVSWKRALGSVGYELQYSTDKKFTRSTTKTVVLKKSTLTQKTLRKLSQKTYYVRICACGRDGVKGAWSKTAKVKVMGN